MVSDAGGIDDRSFNANAVQGACRTPRSEFGIQEVPGVEEPDRLRTQHQLLGQRRLRHHHHRRFLDGGMTKAGAKANPRRFAIVDAASDPTDNMKGLLFNSAQSSFQRLPGSWHE